MELDSCYLPDTQGTTYGTEHVKSTVAVNEIDRLNRRLGYFHGQSYYELNGADFDNVFQTNGLAHERVLPPYIELVKLHKSPEEISEQTLVKESIEALKRQLEFLPDENPFEHFSKAFASELPLLKEKGIEHFHQYSFATLRQFGACYELTATYLKWLTEHSTGNFSKAAENFLEISQTAKTVQFQLARAVARNKDVDLSVFENLATLWYAAVQQVKSEVVAL